jgi:peptide deformylase
VKKVTKVKKVSSLSVLSIPSLLSILYNHLIATLPILTGADNPILRTKTKKVPKVTKELLKLLKDMQDTTVSADGLGLAAPQVGRLERVCIVKIGDKLTSLINPAITMKSVAMEIGEEGCLSLPNIWLEVPRATSIVVKYWNVKGEEQERILEHMDARVVQHEVDHLEGILIVDYGTHERAL